MADTFVPQVTLSESGTYSLIPVGTSSGRDGYLLRVTGSGWTGSLVIKENQAPPGSVASYANVAYQNANTLLQVAAGTAITADGSFVIPVRGYDVAVTYTHTAGSVTLSVSPAHSINRDEADNVGFDPDGDGSAEQTVAEKLRETISVRDFGAVGDGVTDDTAAIQRAVNASANGTLVFPSGFTFAKSAVVTIASPITIVGYGATVLQTTAATAGFNVTSSDVTIEGLRVRGTQYANIQTSEFGINVSAASYAAKISRVFIRNCRIDRWGYEGVRIRWVADFAVEDCTIEQCYYAGVLMWGAEDGSVSRNNIEDLPGTPNAYGITATRGDGASLVTDPRSSRIVIGGNTIKNVPVWNGIDTHGGQDITIIGNVLEGCKKPIWAVPQDSGATPTFAPKNIAIIGNVMKSGVTDGSFDEAIIVVGAGSGVGSVTEYAEGCVVSGNVIVGYGANSTLSGGIYLFYVRGCVVSGNHVIEASTNAVVLRGDCLDVSITGNLFKDFWGSATQAKAVRVQDDNCTAYIAGNSVSRGAKSATFVNNVGVEVISGAANCSIVIGENDWSRIAQSSAINSNSALIGIRSVATTYAVVPSDRTILGDATSAAFDVDLPNAVGAFGRTLTIKKIDASVNAVNVDPSGTQTIDGSATSYALAAQWDSVTIQSDGANWVILSVGP